MFILTKHCFQLSENSNAINENVINEKKKYSV